MIELCDINLSIVGVTPTVLFSNRYYIREVDLHTRHASVRAHNLTNAVALDYDWKDQCLYWSDVTEYGSSLKRLCGNDTSEEHQQVTSSALSISCELIIRLFNKDFIDM